MVLLLQSHINFFSLCSINFFLLTRLSHLEFVDHVFSAIILVLCAGISSYLCFGYTSKKSRETFIGLILLTMLGFQLFHLLRAALYVPATQFLVFNKAFHRTDCLESVKGKLWINLNFEYRRRCRIPRFYPATESFSISIFVSTFEYFLTNLHFHRQLTPNNFLLISNFF